MEQRDIIRWFKKGWAYIIVGAVVNWFVTAIMGVTSVQVLNIKRFQKVKIL